jgi:FkbH-like protein
VLAVCSKNDEANARLPFRDHPDMLLREEHIAVFQANWTDKAANLKAIASALNIAVDALVFLDDNPAERLQVRRELPQVAVPELPDDPALYPRVLSAAGYFEAVGFSKEDRERANYYQANAQRAAALGASSDVGDYLASLQMVCTIDHVDDVARPRVAQLINKSNQFNLTTRRYSEGEVAAAAEDPSRHVVQVRLTDRFGDNGIISVLIADAKGEIWEIDTWLMSCRVLGRRVEEACLAHLAIAARRAGACELIGEFIPSAKNGMVEDHYRSLQKAGVFAGRPSRRDVVLASHARWFPSPESGDDRPRPGARQGIDAGMSDDRAHRLESLLVDHPCALAVAKVALAAWPEHIDYLLKSFRQRSSEMLDASEAVAAAVRKLMDGDDPRYGEDYRWTCDRLREEELYFHREGRYRLSTFADAVAEVYSNEVYMRRYMRGLLLTQVLWYNHVATTDMFLRRALRPLVRPFDYLEIGPGHGLMTYFAACAPNSRALEAWDVSAVSLRETRAALDRLGVSKPVSLVETDILRARPSDRRFDLVVISEVLEHLETPGAALRLLRPAIAEGGQVFINVPINSPSPDHLYLFSSPESVVDLVEGSGLSMDGIELYATQGRPIETALANKISVSAGVIARPK